MALRGLQCSDKGLQGIWEEDPVANGDELCTVVPFAGGIPGAPAASGCPIFWGPVPCLSGHPGGI